STLGRGIDEAARKLSNARGKFERVVARRNDLREERELARVRVREGEVTETDSDSVLWSLAAAEEEVKTTAPDSDDLEAQLLTLRAQLDEQSEAIESQISKLVRKLDTEMVRLEGLAHSLRVPLDRAEAFVRKHSSGRGGAKSQSRS